MILQRRHEQRSGPAQSVFVSTASREHRAHPNYTQHTFLTLTLSLKIRHFQSFLFQSYQGKATVVKSLWCPSERSGLSGLACRIHWACGVSWYETSAALCSSSPIKTSALGASPGSEVHSWKDRMLTKLQVWSESPRTESSWGAVAMTMLLRE